MHQIGILSKPGRSLTLMRSYINKSSYFDPKVFTNSNDFILALKGKGFKAFVLLNDEFKSSHIHIIQQIKKFFPDLPIIIAVEKCHAELKIELTKFRKTILINMNTEAHDINGILMKLIHNEPVNPRLSNRYKTSQPAKVRIGHDKNYSAWIMNLAQDGACFRIFNHKFKKGDVIKIEVPLPQLKKTHLITGKIVWEKADKLKSEFTSFSQRVGIQFLADAV